MHGVLGAFCSGFQVVCRCVQLMGKVGHGVLMLMKP